MCLPGQTLSRNRKRGKILTLNTINDLFSSVRISIYFLAVQIKYSLISEASLGSVFSGARVDPLLFLEAGATHCLGHSGDRLKERYRRRSR